MVKRYPLWAWATVWAVTGCGSEGAPEPPTVTDVSTLPPAGNDAGGCAIGKQADLVDTSAPDQVVGAGTPESCTAAAFVQAVAKGGIITFSCGEEPATILLDKPAKVVNTAAERVVIDGGNRVTLSGGGRTRLLYMNTCDEAQGWTTDHCDNQDHPDLTVQNIIFADGNSETDDVYEGGGAIWVRGGRLKIVNSTFVGNVCKGEGPDLGGGAVRVTSQFDGKPVYVTGSTFGGSPELGNSCANGGALSSIGVSWTIANSVFSFNRAVGNGGNPKSAGTPGGGSGGAIYNDGNTMTLSLCGVKAQYNEVNAYGSAVFFVSNDHSGNVHIEGSSITENVGGSWYPKYPQISAHDDTPIEVIDSTIE